MFFKENLTYINLVSGQKLQVQTCSSKDKNKLLIRCMVFWIVSFLLIQIVLENFFLVFLLSKRKSNKDPYSFQALNLTASLEKSMSRDDAQRFYERMVKNKWLKKSSRGELSLSTRSILELDPLIHSMYPEVARQCNICSRLCLRGQTCNNCQIKLHLYCANRYFKNRESHTCPNCSQEWHHSVPSRESSRRGESNFNTTLDDTSV